MKNATRLLLLFSFCTISYALFWAVRYRIPHAPVAPVDMRRSASDTPYVIEFRASLASNQHGFPGHAYIVWGDGSSAGYVPRFSRDQIPSLYRTVPGFMQLDGAHWNRRNLNALVVLVSKPEYDRTKMIARNWNTSDFRVGKRDCVAFVDTIARTTSLRCPTARYVFPQDYVEQLKHLNCGVTRDSNRTSNMLVRTPTSLPHVGLRHQ
jgi:hypothetical protein